MWNQHGGFWGFALHRNLLWALVTRHEIPSRSLSLSPVLQLLLIAYSVNMTYIPGLFLMPTARCRESEWAKKTFSFLHKNGWCAVDFLLFPSSLSPHSLFTFFLPLQLSSYTHLGLSLSFPLTHIRPWYPNKVGISAPFFFFSFLSFLPPITSPSPFLASSLLLLLFHKVIKPSFSMTMCYTHFHIIQQRNRRDLLLLLL